MAFTLDFSHIPNVGALPVLPLSVDGITQTSKVLVDKMTSDPGALFANPMTNSANLLGDTFTRVEDRLTAIASGTESNPGISQSEATNFLATDPIQSARTHLGNFMMHTGRLSGTLKSFGIDAPGLQQVLSIGVQMQNMMTLLQAQSGCLPVLGGCTGLFSEETFNGYINTMDNLLNSIAQGAATVADIADALGVVGNLIKGIMDKDSQFLGNCVNQLQAAAVGLAIQALDANPCAHFIFDQVSNKNPGGLLNVLSDPLIK